MLKILFIFLLLIRTLYATPLFTPQEKVYIKEHPTLTYSEINWKPLSIIENNSMNGIMGDFLNLISDSTGIKFQYIASKSWQDVLQKFEEGKIDIVPGMGSSQEEKALGLLSDSYANYHMVIVTKNNYRYIDSLRKVQEKVFALPKYFTSYNFIKEKFPDAKIIETKNIQEALLLVQTGKADIFIGHIATSLYYISELNLTDIKISGTANFMFEHHIGVQSNAPLLLSILNKAIKNISEKEKSVIYSKWVNIKVEQKIPLITFLEILATLLLLVLILYKRQKILNKYNKELKLLTQRMQLSLLSIKGGIWDLNLEDGTIYFDENVKAMLGYEENETCFLNKTQDWKQRVHPDDINTSKKIFDDAMRNRKHFFENIHRLEKKDGSWVWVSDMAKIVFDEKGIPIRVIGIISDITQKKLAQDQILRQQDKLSYQAHHDSLTGLPNRVLFMDRLTQSLIRAERKKGQVALLFIDLDEFKQINDSLGHDIGDRVLIEVTKRLRKVTRKEDTLARLGGDEFTIVMNDVKSSQNAMVLSQKVLESLMTPIFIDKHTLHISTSIGISLYPNDDTDAVNLLKYADAAMYKAKNDGRNNYKFYSAEMTEMAFERVVMEDSLREAIKNEEFVVYYQPQMDGAGGKISGVEALVRWKHPTQGLVAPDNFIPLAEKNGLIVQIDRLVMKIAMKQMVEWYKNDCKPGVLALNLSLKQLNSLDFIEFLEETMKEFSFKPEWLELEILEGEIMINPEQSIVALQQLSSMGIELAIDDFGTGYSSLSYLKRLPIDKLKIDKSFVDDLPNDEEDKGISRAIIALAKSLNLRVIAEGVESFEQKEFLVKEGCENIQGYFYSKPLPSDKISQFIREHQ